MKRKRQSIIEKEIEKYFFSDMYETSKNHFYFRAGQEKAIKDLLSNIEKRESGKKYYDTFTLMNTGGGKSICFQYPAIKAKGITIVVSPLVSLINDQVNHFNEQLKAAREKYPQDIPKIKAIALRSDATDGENGDLERSSYTSKKQMVLRHPEIYKLLYVSPEKIASPDFCVLAKKLNISAVVMDEAHCISLWGWDFRSTYLKVLRFINSLNEKTRPVIAAFTATATTNMIEDVKELLDLSIKGDSKSNLKEDQKVRFFVRDNLTIDIINTNCERAAQYNNTKIKKIKEILQSKLHEDIKYNNGKVLIFCRKKLYMNSILEAIPNSVTYHAQMEPAEKKKALHLFNKNNADGGASVMIATKAFGMGIDMDNIDAVIHFDIPDCIEEYYQQIGRAGRDRKRHDAKNPAKTYLLYNENDKDILKYISSQYKKMDLSKHPDVKSRYKKIYASYRMDKMVEIIEQVEKTKNSDVNVDEKAKELIEVYFNDTHVVEDNEYKKERLASSVDFYLMNTTKLAHTLRKGDYVSGEEKVIEVTDYYGSDVLFFWEEDLKRDYIQKNIYSEEYCKKNDTASNLFDLSLTNNQSKNMDSILKLIKEAYERQKKDLKTPYIIVRCRKEKSCTIGLNRLPMLAYRCIKESFQDAHKHLVMKTYGTASFIIQNGCDEDGNIYSNLNEFDMMVADAIYTLGEFEKSKKGFNPDDIDRVLTGNEVQRGRRRSCNNRDEYIKKSIDKLRNTSIIIQKDNSGMIYQNAYQNVFGWEGKMINISLQDRGRGGWFYYEGKSPLNEYVEQGNGQQFCFSFHRLNVCFDGEHSLRHSAVNMLLVHYILYRIWLVRPSKGPQGTYDKSRMGSKKMIIRLEKTPKHPERRTIYDMIENSFGIKNLSYIQKKELVNKILMILDRYVASFDKVQADEQDIFISYDGEAIKGMLMDTKKLPGEIKLEYT